MPLTFHHKSKVVKHDKGDHQCSVVKTREGKIENSNQDQIWAQITKSCKIISCCHVFRESDKIRLVNVSVIHIFCKYGLNG